MDNKPIKRSKEIISLSQEHHYSLLFSWKIRKGLKKDVPLSQILKYVDYFWNEHLRRHFEQEQQTLFAQQSDNVLVENVIEEQRQAEAYFKNLKKFKGDEDGLSDSLNRLADFMEEMVRKEERELFPDLESRLSQEQLEKVGEEIRKMQPRHLVDEYEDEFWTTEK